MASLKVDGRYKIKVPKDVRKHWKPLNKNKKDLIKHVLEESLRELSALEPESTSSFKSLCEIINVECDSILEAPTSDEAENDDNAQKRRFKDPKTISKAMSNYRHKLEQLENNNEKLRIELETAKEKLDTAQLGKTHSLLKPRKNGLNLPSLYKTR